MKKLLYLLLISPLFFISSCEEEEPIHGCLDSQACNYNPETTLDNNSCEYAPEGFDCDDLIGCADTLACNFNSEAIPDNSFCEYALQGYDCDGNEVPQIGDQHSGGIVFYIDETGEHGLIAAMEDLTEGATDTYGWGFNGYEWGCYQIDVSGADGQAIGTGYQNTMDIVNQGCDTENGGITAAQAALDAEINHYSDWYLPSNDELNEMYNTIGPGGQEGNIGGFSGNWYWSSSENYSNFAWVISLTNGGTGSLNKGNTYRVRVIRAF